MIERVEIIREVSLNYGVVVKRLGLGKVDKANVILFGLVFTVIG